MRGVTNVRVLAGTDVSVSISGCASQDDDLEGVHDVRAMVAEP
jgi:hypothetical protein